MSYLSDLTITRGTHHLNVDCEDGVGPGGVCIHLCRPRGPVTPAFGHQRLTLRSVGHWMQGDVLDTDNVKTSSRCSTSFQLYVISQCNSVHFEITDP